MSDSLGEAAKKQAKHWGTVGDAWRQDGGLVETWFAPVTHAMNSYLPARGGVLLDVGCGAMTMPYPSGWRLHGVDVAAEMSPNVVGDEARLPFRSKCADAIVSRFSYMLSANPALAFAEAYRCLRRDGVLVFAVWSSGEKNQWASCPMDYLCDRLGLSKPGRDEPHAFRLADTNEVEALLLRGGFRKVQKARTLVPYFQSLPPARALELVLHLAGPIRLAFDRVPAEEKTEVVSELETLAARIDWSGNADVWSAEKSG